MFAIVLRVSDLLSHPEAVYSYIKIWGTTVYSGTFLGAFAKVRKATVSFVMSTRPSVRIILDISVFFRKYVEKIHVSLKSDKNNGYITWKRFYIYDNISLNSS